MDELHHCPHVALAGGDATRITVLLESSGLADAVLILTYCPACAEQFVETMAHTLRLLQRARTAAVHADRAEEATRVSPARQVWLEHKAELRRVAAELRGEPAPSTRLYTPAAAAPSARASAPTAGHVATPVLTPSPGFLAYYAKRGGSKVRI